MKMKSLVLATVAFAALAAPALAQQGTPPTPEERAAAFDKADANKDGKLDMAEFKEMNAVYERMFDGHRPARTTIQAAGLPGEGLRVEIDCIAYIP